MFGLAVRSGVADVSLFFTFASMIKYRGQLHGSHELFQIYDFVSVWMCVCMLDHFLILIVMRCHVQIINADMFIT